MAIMSRFLSPAKRVLRSVTCLLSCSLRSRKFSSRSSIQYHDFTFLDSIWRDGKLHHDYVHRNVTPAALVTQKPEKLCALDLIILNCPADVLLTGLCASPCVRRIICADGGANALYRCVGDFIPTAVVGDLDSVDHNVLTYYEQKRAMTVYRPDEHSTDFEKSVRVALALDPDAHTDWKDDQTDLLCWGAFGERFDHEMQAFSVMRKYSHDHPKMHLMSSKNYATVLPPGKHVIKKAQIQGPVCGLIPMFQATKLTTQGLKWNLHDEYLEFGSRISSSNEFLGDGAEIECDNDIVLHTACIISYQEAPFAW